MQNLVNILDSVKGREGQENPVK